MAQSWSWAQTAALLILAPPDDAGPFAEGEVCSDDDGSALVELAGQVELKLAAGLGGRGISQFIEN
jgi:hypothetical protein